MSGSFEIDDVLGGAPPPWKVLVLRGLFRRCPRCGGGHVFERRFRLKDRCETCGYQFRREPGFALGAWFINFGVLQLLLLVEFMTFIVWKSNRPDAGLTLLIVGGVATAIAVPILFYPYSQTIWAGIDLAMTPLELDEIVEAADFVDAGRTSDVDQAPSEPADASDSSNEPDPTMNRPDDADQPGESDPPPP